MCENRVYRETKISYTSEFAQKTNFGLIRNQKQLDEEAEVEVQFYNGDLKVFKKKDLKNYWTLMAEGKLWVKESRWPIICDL
jgi:hypothetical protein